MTLPDFSSLWLSFQLAGWTTLILLIIATPLAWWLAHSQSKAKPLFEALIALPLVLPPTVMGFYLLILLNPNSLVGGFWLDLTGQTLTFSFSGLVIASIFYSLPFMVQPLQSAFESMTERSMQLAASLGASPRDAFFTVAFPLARRGFLTAIVLSFAHTLGEFGIVLMVGGNISERTRVVSIEIYEHVESLNYSQAHALSLLLLIISFCVLFFVYAYNRRFAVHVS